MSTDLMPAAGAVPAVRHRAESDVCTAVGIRMTGAAVGWPTPYRRGPLLRKRSPCPPGPGPAMLGRCCRRHLRGVGGPAERGCWRTASKDPRHGPLERAGRCAIPPVGAPSTEPSWQPWKIRAAAVAHHPPAQ